MTREKTIAIALRAAAENLDRARQLVQDLPARVLGADEAFTIFQDAPKVSLALAVIAGSLDPEPDPAGEMVGELGQAPLLSFPTHSEMDVGNELVGDLPADVQAELDRRCPPRRFAQ